MRFFISTLFLIGFSFNYAGAQEPNIFSKPDNIVEYLDGKTFTVPNYGIIKFEYNKSDTKRLKESRIKDGADDEIADLVFDVQIKRNDSKRKDKAGYKIELKIDLNDADNGSTAASSPYAPYGEYVQYFALMRNVIYPIKNFPYMFHLFADGDLYYVKSDYKKMSFAEFKNGLISAKDNLSGLGFENYASRTFIKCTPVNKK
jgi:hypothetical protein